MLSGNVLQPVDKFIGFLGSKKDALYDKKVLKNHYIQHYMPYHVRRSL